jgi:anti-sigma regulatory factor (Ser/Thr protein kinase)
MSDVRHSAIVLVNDRSEIQRLAEVAEHFGEANRLSADDVLRLRLVLDEIVVNIIAHGYEEAGDTERHEIHVRLALDHANVLTIQVEDDARAYDPRNAPVPKFDLPIEQRRRGGLGVHIVKAIMETVDYRRENGRNVLTLTKRLDGTARHSE